MLAHVQPSWREHCHRLLRFSGVAAVALWHSECRLDVESANRTELWHRCDNLEQELHSTSDKLAATSTNLKAAEQELGEDVFSLFLNKQQ
jgi:hypothetical protein